MYRINFIHFLRFKKCFTAVIYLLVLVCVHVIMKLIYYAILFR